MKKILLGLGALIVIAVVAIAGLSFATPTDFKVEKEIVIAKPKAEVFAYVKNLKNQSIWGPWAKQDPNIKLSYVGNDGDIGFIYKWESEMENVGVGEQEIKKITEGERIDHQIRFKKPFESNADSFLITEDAGEGKTKVKWGFESKMPRPMNLMLLFVDMDKEVGKDFQSGLTNLKGILEKSE